MAIEGVPWMVAGGLHSAEVGRQLAFAATNGASGVILPGDLEVSALPTPGAAVRVAPGGAVIPSRYAGADGQSYIARGVSATDYTISGSSTSARVLYVVLRVSDPAYPGQPLPANAATGPYVRIEAVSSITNLEVPFVALARLNIPANTTVITNAMITNLRAIANPREKQLVLPKSTLADNMQLTGATSDGQSWPTQGADFYIDVPEWATSMQIEAHWIAVQLQPANTSGWGDYWVDYGPVLRPEKHQYSTRIFHWDLPAGDVSRGTWDLVDEVVVPQALRGTRVPFRMKASKSGSAVPKMDSRSGAVLKVRFIEGI